MNSLSLQISEYSDPDLRRQYFPSGVPHSLQGLSPNGTEFLLIFDDGSFSEESTFVLTDWLGKCSRNYWTPPIYIGLA